MKHDNSLCVLYSHEVLLFLNGPCVFLLLKQAAVRRGVGSGSVETGAPQGPSEAYFNTTVCVLVYVGGWAGHGGSATADLTSGCARTVWVLLRRPISPSLRKSQTQSVLPDVDRCAALSGTTSAGTWNKRCKHTGRRATLGLSCSPPLETAFLGSHKILGKHRTSFQEAARAPRCGPLRHCRCSINNLNIQQSPLIQMWGVMSWRDTQRVVAVVEVGADSWSSDKMQQQCSAPCWTGEVFAQVHSEQ